MAKLADLLSNFGGQAPEGFGLHHYLRETPCQVINPASNAEKNGHDHTELSIAFLDFKNMKIEFVNDYA